ncbi:MAG: GNAT family N-acetyltransferase [Flavobacterium sp.]
MIVRATAEDHVSLSILTKRSKAYWGYSAEQMAQWDSQLTITPEYISANETYILVSGEKTAGYYSLHKSDTHTIILDNLFVDPEFIGKGHGKLLLADAVERARGMGFKTIALEADSNAESFYRRFGFITAGQAKTSVPGRLLPVMQLQV